MIPAFRRFLRDVERGINGFSAQPLSGGALHRYVLLAAAWGEAPAQRAAAVDSIPFTHPAHVPALLQLLRHQSAINTLLRSCIGPPGDGAAGRGAFFAGRESRYRWNSGGRTQRDGLLMDPVKAGSVPDLHLEVLPESETSFSVTFQRPDADSLAVCEHFRIYNKDLLSFI